MVGGVEAWIEWACLPQLARYKKGHEWGWEPSIFVERLEWEDSTHIGFTLKKGMQWSGGYGEVTTEDVKYSLERIKGSQWEDFLAALDHVEIIDDYSGRIVLEFPFAPIMLIGLCYPTGSILCKKALEEVGGTYTTEFPAIGGQYEMVEWTPKQRLVLEPNPDWVGEAPAVDRIEVINIEDEKAAELAYEAGEIDLTEISLDSVLRYQEELADDSNLLMLPGLRYAWIGMNTEHPKLQDIRVRKAIQRAIDVDTILEGAYSGITPKGHGIVPPGLPGARSESGYSYNIEEARALIQEAGAEGLELEFVTLNKADRLAAATIAQANLAEIGIVLDIVPLEGGPFWSQGLESEGEDWKDLQLWMMRYGGSPDPYDMFQWFVRSQVGVWNWERWSDDEFEELYAAGLRETDTAKRAEIYVRMQEIMEDTGAYVWIGHDPSPIIYRDTIDPWITPVGNLFFPGFEWA
jgi:peptide/nickel transport system substrate-binding protein